MDFKKTLLVLSLLISNLAAGEYFQQGVSYRINAELNPNSHKLTLKSEMIYVNNSPDTLNEIYLRLHWNIFKKDSYARQKNSVYRVIYSRVTEGTEIKNVTLNNKSVNDVYELDNTIMKIPVEEKLLPGESASIVIDAVEEVPVTRLRMGRLGSDYYIAHWFPAVCVYDKLGWQIDQYLGEGEFNEETGNYEVNITLPTSYLAYHTGYLLNDSEVLPDSIIMNLQDARSSGKLTRIYTPVAGTSELNDSVTKTWKLKADSVRTFAFAALKNKVWDACYDNGVMINTVYSLYNEKYYTDEGMNAAVHAVKFFSNKFGRYPYPNVFVVGARNFGGGMEYPGITFVSDSPVESMFSKIQSMMLVHEIGHNWCPMTINTNETRFAFMDEGTTDYWTMKALENLYGADFNFLDLPDLLKSIIPPLVMYDAYYNMVVINELNRLREPVLTHSDRYKNSSNYSIDSYQKTTMILSMLRYLIGEDAFSDLFHEYFKRFRFRHVYPQDFFNLVQEINYKHNGVRDLSWFFDEWFVKTELLDYGLKDIDCEYDGNTGKYKTVIKIESLEDAVMPCDVDVEFEDGTHKVVKFDVREFLNGPPVVSKMFEFDSKPVGAEIDPQMKLLDVNRMNNYSSVIPPVSFRLNTIVDMSEFLRADKYHVYWFPAIGFNNIDGFKLGLNLKGTYLGIDKNIEVNVLQGMKFGKNSFGGDIKMKDKIKFFGPLADASLHYFNYEGRRGGSVSFSKYLELYKDYPACRFKITANYFDAYDDRYFNAEAFDKPDNINIGIIRQRKYFWINSQFAYYNSMNMLNYNAVINYESGFTSNSNKVREGFQKLTLQLKQRIWLPFFRNVKLRQFIGYSPAPLPSAKSYYLATVNPVDEFSSYIYRTPGIISKSLRAKRSVPNGGGYLRGYYNQNNFGDVITAVNAEISSSFILKYIPVIGNIFSNITWLFADAGNVWNYVDEIKMNRFLYDYGFSIKFPLRARLMNYVNMNPFEFLNKLGINSINFDFPLYVSNPPAGEKKFQFRWLFGFQSPL